MKKQDGVTLPETIMTVAILMSVCALLVKGVNAFAATGYQHNRLMQINETVALTREITRMIRNARSIETVDHKNLVLTVYNFRDYPNFDKRAITNPRKVTFRYEVENGRSFIRRSDYKTLTETTPESERKYLSHVRLFGHPALAVDDENPLFKIGFTLGAAGNIVKKSVEVKICLEDYHRTRKPWAPVAAEAVLYGQKIES